MKNIAVFASGNGTNAHQIMRYFAGDSKVKIRLVVTNNEKAAILNKCKQEGVPCFVFPKDNFVTPDALITFLIQNNIDYIVLAGFLLQIPRALIKEFPKKIINIHPALLPKFGGKGMYGSNVHKAVMEAGEKETGITIHYVNEQYDKGEIILQQKCAIAPEDTVESVALKVQQLEHEYYPETLNNIIK